MRPNAQAVVGAATRLPWAVLLLTACSGHTDPPRQPQPPGLAAIANGRVDIEGGLLPLTAPRNGTVISVSAREGASVQRGDLLVTLDNREARLAVDGAAAELRQELARQQLLASQLATARERAGRLAAAARAGAGELQAADDAEGIATELAGQLRMAQAAIDISRYKHEAARQELELLSVRAPFDAQIVRVTTQPGARASPQSRPLVTLLPRGSIIVRADVSESYIAAVRVGMPATVGTEDDRGGTWPAHVLRISPVEGTLPAEDEPPPHMSNRTVECVLAIDAPTSLRIGQRVLVRFGAPAASGKH